MSIWFYIIIMILFIILIYLIIKLNLIKKSIREISSNEIRELMDNKKIEITSNDGIKGFEEYGMSLVMRKKDQN